MTSIDFDDASTHEHNPHNGDLEHMMRRIEGARLDGDRQRESALLRSFAVRSLGRGEIELALRTVGLALTLSQTDDDALGEAAALRVAAQVFLHQDRRDEVVETLHQALSIYQRVDAPISAGHTLHALSQVSVLVGDFDQAHQYMRESMGVLGTDFLIGVPLPDLSAIIQPISVVVDSFAAAWRHGLDAADMASLDRDDLTKIGRNAGEQAAAAAAWRSRLGDTVDTERVVQLLGGISRQALDSRKRTGSLFALPGTGTSHYPTWQFATDGNTATVRPVVLRIVSEFREQLDDVSPFTIAAWATSPQPELDSRTPADWITNNGDDAPVVLAARRTAHLEAQ